MKRAKSKSRIAIRCTWCGESANKVVVRGDDQKRLPCCPVCVKAGVEFDTANPRYPYPWISKIDILRPETDLVAA